MVAPVAETLTLTTAATNAERVDTMHMTAIGLARGEVAAVAGPVHGLGLVQDPGEGVTGHEAEAMIGGIDHRLTQSVEAGLPPLPGQSPEVLCAGPGHLCAGQGLQCAGQVVRALVPDQFPAPGRAVSPDLAPGPDPVPLPPRESVVPDLPAQEKAQHLTLTDSRVSCSPYPICLRA